MEIDAVTDSRSLAAYINALPIEQRLLTARRVGHRSAARVAPIGLKYCAPSLPAELSEVTALPICLALSLSGVAATHTTPEIGTAAVRVGAISYTTNSVAHAADAEADVLDTKTRDNTESSVYAETKTRATTVRAAAGAHAAAAQAAAATHTYAARFAADVAPNTWKWIRQDLALFASDPLGALPPLWQGISEPREFATAWQEARAALAADTMAGDPARSWRVFILMMERIRAGHEIHAEVLAPILDTLTREEIEGDPADVLPRFDPLLALYEAEGAGGDGPTPNSVLHIKTIRAQVSTLKDFLETEYLQLSGHNARSPEQDALLDLLRDLKDIVDGMLERLEGETEPSRAIAEVDNTLPAIVEKAGELAVVEPEPQVSATVSTMALSIKTLVDAGADPKLATQIAMSEAAGNKLLPRLRQFFNWSRKNGE